MQEMDFLLKNQVTLYFIDIIKKLLNMFYIVQ